MTAQLTAYPTLERQRWLWQGHHIEYTVQGTGLPLVLVHGFGASIGHWRKNIPVLAEAGYQVHALDLLGFGGSDKPAMPYAVEVWEALLQDYWRSHIGQPAVFVGNSIGGLITLMMLANSPEMAKAGVLLNCAGGLNHRPEELNLPLRFVMGTFSKLVSSDLLGPFIFN
ncbi:MAG: alpha/beta fold hydrolase, partial [Cyanobacteria bacterium P01_H01_bin.58]